PLSDRFLPRSTGGAYGRGPVFRCGSGSRCGPFRLRRPRAPGVNTPQEGRLKARESDWCETDVFSSRLPPFQTDADRSCRFLQFAEKPVKQDRQKRDRNRTADDEIRTEQVQSVEDEVTKSAAADE